MPPTLRPPPTRRPPAADADKQGSRYWRYSINELGVYDIGAGGSWVVGGKGYCSCVSLLALTASRTCTGSRGERCRTQAQGRERQLPPAAGLVPPPMERAWAGFRPVCPWARCRTRQPMLPLPAVVAHIHNTKMAELAAPGRHTSIAASQEAPAQQTRQLRRSSTDSQLGALRWVDVHSGSSRGDLEPASSSAAPWGEAAAEGRPAAGSRQQEGSAEHQGEQPWWQRLGARSGAASQRELTMALVGEGAAPLRRVQSAPEPLVSLGQEAAAQFAVPVRMEQQQQPQRPSSSGKRGSSSCGKRGGSGGKRGSNSGGGSGGSRGGSAAASSSSSGAAGGPSEVLPYRLQAVGHSLGAASLMVYAVVCRMRGQPHHLRRLVLMSPAGFHPRIPGVRVGFSMVWGLCARLSLCGHTPGCASEHGVAASLQVAVGRPAALKKTVGCRCCVPPQGMVPCKYLFPPLVRLLDRTPWLRNLGMGMRLPSPLLRYITFKFSMVGPAAAVGQCVGSTTITEKWGRQAASAGCVAAGWRGGAQAEAAPVTAPALPATLAHTCD